MRVLEAHILHRAVVREREVTLLAELDNLLELLFRRRHLKDTRAVVDGVGRLLRQELARLLAAEVLLKLGHEIR